MKQTNHVTMQAGVIGSNWGRVHVAGLRQAGCQVQALMAHDAELVARIAAALRAALDASAAAGLEGDRS